MFTISTWSIVFFCLYIIMILLISWFSMRKVKNSDDSAGQFYLGGRTIPTCVIAVSFMCSATSSGAMLGDPAMMGLVGWPYFWVVVACPVSMTLAIILLMRRMHGRATVLQTLTVPEFIGSHYQSPKLQTYISILLAFFYIFTLSAQFKGAAVLLESFLGISFTTGLLVAIALSCVMAIAGGLTSLSWSDFAQGIPMFAIVIFFFIAAMVSIGGFNALDTALLNIDPNMVRAFDPSGSGGWGTPLSVISIFIFYFGIFASQPYICTRFMALKDTKRNTIRTFLIMVVILAVVVNLLYVVGMVARVKYGDSVPADYYTTRLAMDLLPKPIAALFMIGILSAILTTTTSILLVVGQTLGRDLWQRVLRPRTTGPQVVKASRVLVLAVAILIFILNNFNPPALLASFLYMGLSGTGCALAVPLICSLYWKGATKQGAWACAISGPFLYLFLDIQTFIDLNYFICCAAGIICAAVVMVVVSLLTKKFPVPAAGK